MHPEWYHGHDRKPPLFEGWYFKLVDPSGEHRYAIIPWLGSTFWGTIVGLWHEGRLYRFATYTGAKMERRYGDLA